MIIRVAPRRRLVGEAATRLASSANVYDDCNAIANDTTTATTATTTTTTTSTTTNDTNSRTLRIVLQ